jgi:hypothetical protein
LLAIELPCLLCIQPKGALNRVNWLAGLGTPLPGEVILGTTYGLPNCAIWAIPPRSTQRPDTGAESVICADCN